MSSFDQFGLSDALLRAVQDLGYTTTTPIQARAIPAAMEGRDLLAAAQTGTGKTAAFALPLLQRLQNPASGPNGAPTLRRAPRALILVPTRELAAQVHQTFVDLGRHQSLRITLIFGGVSPRPQIDALARGVDIIIATPGRLLDHASQRAVDLSRIEMLVLDEADRMLDMGFIRDIRRILAMLPKSRQNLLFSATFSDEIRSLAKSFLSNPLAIEVSPRNAPAELVEHSMYHCEPSQKRAVLSHLVREGSWTQTLVFTRTKHGANRLAEQLEQDGLRCAAIHGNKSQGARTRALADFKASNIEVLVATDIAARGLDIVELPHVVNYEMPHVPEDYVHRIGRTGRAGCAGHAISLVSREERDRFRAVERVLGRPIPVLPTPTVLVAPAAPQPGSAAREEQRYVDPRAQHSGQRHAQRPAAGRGSGGHRGVTRSFGPGGGGRARVPSAGRRG